MSTNHHIPARVPGPACARFAALLPLLDQPEIGRAELAQARAHVETCAHCQAELATYGRLDGALHAHFGLAATPHLRTSDLLWSIAGIPAHEMEQIMADTSEPTTSVAATTSDTEDARHFAPLPDIRDDHRPRGPRRRLISLAAALAAVLLVGVLAQVLFSGRLHGTRPTAQTPQLAPITLPGCLVGAALSPDGQTVAVLGYQGDCPHATVNTGYVPGVLVLYDTRTHQLIGKITPDTMIIQKLGFDPNAQSANQDGSALQPGQTPALIVSNVGVKPTLTILYQSVIWSPDGTHIALPFTIQTTCYCDDANGRSLARVLTVGPSTTGVVLSDALAQHQSVIAAPLAAGGAAAPVLEWNMASGQSVAVTSALSPALGYHWGANGALLSEYPLGDALPSPRPAATAIGNPSGGASFSIWQPGQGGLAAAGGGFVVSVRGLYIWTTRFAAWSPDAHYLLVSNFLTMRVVSSDLPSADASAIAGNAYATAPLIQPRDAAMSAIFRSMVPPNTKFIAGTFFAPSRLSWRPDGRFVAVQVEAPGSPRPADQVVRIYDTATGRVVKTLTPQSILTRTPADADPFLPDTLTGSAGETLQWSADGTTLLLADANLGTLTIWAASDLPR